MDSSVPASSSPASSLSASRNGESSTSSSSTQVREREEAEAEDSYRHQEPVQRQPGFAYHTDFPSTNDETSTLIRDDIWSCVIVVFTFWFFVAMTLMLGVYGSMTTRLGSNCSLLIQPNQLFVDYVKVEEFDEIKPGLMLYGIYKVPPPVYAATWSDNYAASLPAGSHKDWIYFLNEKSQINISYSVNSPSASPLILIIAEGYEGFAQWLEDQSYPNSTLLWKLIHGSGMVHQDILKSSSYYVALGNMNFEEAEVQLNLSIRGFLYNTTEAYYKCNLARGPCSLKLFFPKGNAAVLTSPASHEGKSSIDSYVRVSYGPRWITYLAGIGGLTVLMILTLHIFKNFHCTRDGGARVQFGEMGSARAPLLSHKDDDLSSRGSSYDSVSDDEDPEDGLAVGSLEGKAVKDGEYNNNVRRLCAICFDAPRDCFFLPCGHCVACFACGTRIAELAGTCPICRRNMKKVRKIFTV